MAYVTKAEVLQHGGMDSNDALGAEISSLIARAESAIESDTGNVFELTSTSTRKFDAIANVDGSILYFDEWLANTTSLVITNGDADETVIASTKYVTLPRNSTPIYGIQLKTDTTDVWEYSTSPEDAISVVGNWGYSENPSSDVKLACIMLILHWLRQEDQSDDKDFPSDVCKLLKHYTRAVAWL
jgi:hypothetical protein